MLDSILQTILRWGFVSNVICLSTPILFAALASYVAASTGVANIAIEGIMTMTALMGVLGSYWTQSAVMGIIIGLISGMAIALLIGFFTMKLGASNILVGIALNTFADSIAIFILYSICGEKGTSAKLLTPTINTLNIPIIEKIPVLGNILSGNYILTYVCWILAIVLAIMIFKTPLGIRMRACGLNADAAKTAGINVKKLQLFSLVLSGLFAALGGMFLSLNYLRIFSKAMVSGQGWMGIAANGIANGNYFVLILSSIIFGFFKALSVSFGTNANFPTDLVAAIPYFAVFVGITVFSISNYYRIKKGKVEEQ